MRLDLASYAVLFPGFAATLLSMWRAGNPESLGWWLLALPFAVWCGAPYFVYGFAASRVRRSSAAATVMLLAALALSGSAVAILRDAFGPSLDAQSGLVFLFLPIWQLPALLPFLGLALWLRRRADRDAASSEGAPIS